MKTTSIFYALGLVLISVFLISMLWEFGVEDWVAPLFSDDFRPEPNFERWEYVITATLFAGLALVYPALLLVRMTGRLRAFNAELETRVEQRTRQSRRQLAERQRIEEELRHEIAERQQAESVSARMGRIIENVLLEVYVFDADTLRFLQVNRCGRENLGYAMEQLRTRTCTSLVADWTPESWREKLAPLREGTVNELVFETTHKRKDGSQYDVECRIQYLRYLTPPVFVATLQDITARKQMEAQIAEARDKAEAASAAKTLFLANISHELRTPMNAVIGMSEVLGKSPLSPEQQHYVQTIHDSGTAYLDIIDGLLDLSMVESGRFTPREREFDLHAVVEAVLELLAYRACQWRLDLLSLVDEDVPVWLRGDALALRQILLNLLGNAIKYTDRGVVDLRVSVVTRSRQQCRLRFAVRDTGAGISAERQSELFQPFTQGDSVPSGHGAGVGLGLSICKSLIDALHGTIGVESKLGEGSLFWCEVDFAIGTVPEGETVDRELPAGLLGLVVDDNPLACSTLQSQLQALGVRAEAVGGGLEALEALRRAVAGGDRCAFAVIDADMPGIDGLSLAQAIKSEPTLAGTRLLMLTQMDAPIVSETQQRIGFEMQCPKPIRQSQLPDTLRMLMDGQKEAAAEDRPDASAVARAGATPLKILVVDDQPVNQEVMQLMLRRLGCEVDLADSAEEALDLLRERTQDAVFMDCLMPGMDGYAATAAIRRCEPDQRRVVIIAMTALAMPGERERCLEAGMDDYLCKPVSETVLRQTLKRWFPKADPGADEGAGAAAEDGDAGALLRQLQAGQPEMMPKLVDTFLDTSAGSLKAMRETLQQGDLHELANRAHALKGACLQLGETGMAECCDRLEAAGHGGDRDAAGATMAQLSAAFEQASAELLALKARTAGVE